MRKRTAHQKRRFARIPDAVHFSILSDDGFIRLRTTRKELLGKLDTLTGHTHLTWLLLPDLELDDNHAQAIAAIIRNNPGLEQLDLAGNRFTDKGVAAIADALQQHRSVFGLNFYQKNPPAGDHAADAMQKLVSALPKLKYFQCHLPPMDGAEAERLADAFSQAKDLVQIQMRAPDAAVLSRLLEPLSKARNLAMTNLSITGETRPLAEIPNPFNHFDTPNLIQVYRHPQGAEEMCEHNTRRTRAALKDLESNPEALDYAATARLHEQSSAIRQLSSDAELPCEAFDAFLSRLPRLPENGGVEDLFTADAEGYAPLDNPLLWKNGARLFDFIEKAGQPLDAAFLSRRTPRGVSLLESAAGAMYLPDFFRELQRRNAPFHSQLLDGNGAISDFFAMILERKAQSLLFQPDLWLGTSPQLVRQALRAMPEDARKDVPVHMLMAMVDATAPTQNQRGR